MKKLVLLLFCMPFLLSSSCENDDEDTINCTLEAVAALNVTVIDAITNAPLSEGVVVTATEGEFTETLENILETNVFSGVWERKGTYIISVTKLGYQNYTSNSIVVTANVCHVNPKSITVSLQPE